MARTLIKNVQVVGIGLPAPYRGILGPGRSTVVDDIVDDVISALGGADTILGVLEVSTIPDSSELGFDDNVTQSIPLATVAAPGLLAQLSGNINQYLGGTGAFAEVDHGMLVGTEDDDHLQYQLRSEQDAADGYPSLDSGGKVPVGQLGSGATPTRFLRGDQTWEAVPGGVTDHGDLTGLADDDHPQYQKESERGAVNGYASLNGSARVPTVELGSGTASSATFLRGDQTYATPTNVVPAVHAISHQSGGTDAIKIDDLAEGDDNTDLDSSTLRHGLLPKLSGVSTQFLNGSGSFSLTPTGTPAVAVVTETAFGQAPAVGIGADFAKGDHTHGTPVDPVPPHVAAADPHAQYQKESEKSTAGGYASLNGSSRVPTVELGSGTASATTFLAGDESYKVPSQFGDVVSTGKHVEALPAIKTSSATLVNSDVNTLWNVAAGGTATMPSAPVNGQRHALTNLNAATLTVVANAGHTLHVTAPSSIALGGAQKYIFRGTIWYPSA